MFISDSSTAHSSLKISTDPIIPESTIKGIKKAESATLLKFQFQSELTCFKRDSVEDRTKGLLEVRNKKSKSSLSSISNISSEFATHQVIEGVLKVKTTSAGYFSKEQKKVLKPPKSNFMF